MSPGHDGCGSGACGCGGQAATVPASVNGINLLAEGERLAQDALRERAWSELLRQEALACRRTRTTKRRPCLPATGR